MSKEDKTEQKGKEEDGQVQIRWDGSAMRSTYANVTNVSSTREEVTVLFGTNKSWHNAHKELTVELSDRLILNPFAAKRLSILLNNVVKGYEEQFGVLELEMPVSGEGPVQ
jgi:hypothetical protein